MGGVVDSGVDGSVDGWSSSLGAGDIETLADPETRTDPETDPDGSGAEGRLDGSGGTLGAGSDGVGSGGVGSGDGELERTGLGAPLPGSEDGPGEGLAVAWGDGVETRALGGAEAPVGAPAPGRPSGDPAAACVGEPPSAAAGAWPDGVEDGAAAGSLLGAVESDGRAPDRLVDNVGAAASRPTPPAAPVGRAAFEGAAGRIPPTSMLIPMASAASRLIAISDSAAPGRAFV